MEVASRDKDDLQATVWRPSFSSFFGLPSAQRFRPAFASPFANAGRNVFLIAVGYNTIQINKQYTLLTVNFNDVSGEDMPVQKLFPYSEGMTAGKTDDVADNIQVMKDDDSMGYDIYFLWNGKSGKGEGTVSDPEDVNKWSKVGVAGRTSDVLHKGKSMWYQSRAAKADDDTTWYNITVAGSVSLAEKHEFEINKQYTLVGSPFPVEIPLNGGVVVTEPTMGKTEDTADNIQIMKADSSMGYDIYFVWNGKSGKGEGTVSDPEDVGKWSKVGVSGKTSDAFPVGRGAWFQSRGKTGMLKFINPVAK